MAKALFDASTVAAGNLVELASPVAGAIVSKPLIDSGALKQILFAMDGGQQISEHKAPFVVTVHVLSGRLTFRAAGESHSMGPNDWIVLPADVPHDLIAAEPAVFLLTLVKG